jgi:tetratricopeptide (TPR) repeat protein
METMILENYIQMAEKAFESNDYIKGMNHLEEALMCDPHFGKAHNHMGWLYIYHLKDWTKAEKHLNLAMKYSPDYAPTYIHLSEMYLQNGRFDDLENMLERAQNIGGVQKAFIFNMKARMQEIKGRYHKAITLNKQAVKWCMNDQEVNNLKAEIKRCRKKRQIIFL